VPMDRRTFLQSAACLPLASSLWPSNTTSTPATRLSAKGRHHFFGYYGINPWDRGKRYHLALETDFDNRIPTINDQAQVGLVDIRSSRFIPLAKTNAFNFQQGSMMHWIDAGFGEEFVYNARE